MLKTLIAESFKKKELAEQKGGLYEYQQYKEGSKAIVIRMYTSEFAVDYYNGIDLEDSDSGTHDGDAWPAALVIANRFFREYEFTGKPDEE